MSNRYLFRAPAASSPAAISESMECKRVAEKILRTRNIAGIQVMQKNSIIYLSGKVVIPREKYRLEELLQGIEGISALDLSGIDILYPNGYYYTVKEGDNLWMIADKIWGNGAEFERIHQANRQTILDPSKISPGLIIIMPE
jgi:nucleoid-associated protein YgaU